MRYFDLLAPVYDRFMPPPDPDWWMELLRLPVAGPLLDAGGGTGRISAELRRLVGSAIVVDISGGMLRRARHKGGVEAVQGDAGCLPFRDGVFPRAVAADALHHFPEPDLAIRELLRVLAPGGRLVIEDFDLRRLPVKALALAEKMMLMGSRFFPPAEICRMVEAAGGEATVRQGPRFAIYVVADKKTRSA